MREGRVLRWSCRAIALLLAAWTLQRYVWLPYRGNHLLFQIDQRTEEAAKAGTYQGLPAARENLARLDTIAGLGRTEVYYQMLYAANTQLLHRWDETMQHLDAALAIDRRPEIYYRRGLLRVERGEVDAAIPDLVLAVRFNPALGDELDENLRRRVRSSAGLE